MHEYWRDRWTDGRIGGVCRVKTIAIRVRLERVKRNLLDEFLLPKERKEEANCRHRHKNININKITRLPCQIRLKSYHLHVHLREERLFYLPFFLCCFLSFCVSWFGFLFSRLVFFFLCKFKRLQFNYEWLPAPACVCVSALQVGLFCC